MTAMEIRRSGWLIVAVLTAWVILGPIGMAFDSCAAMMEQCDGGPCGAVSAVIDTTPSLTPPIAVMVAALSPPKAFTPVPRSALEPPPKFVRLSA